MSFTFNGRNCEDFGIFVEKYPSRQIPTKKMSQYSVPGKSGKVFIPQGGYDNIVQPYEVFVKGGVAGFQAHADEIAAWLLTQNEPMELTDSYDPTAMRLAMYIGGVDWENSLNKFGKVLVSFDCDPRRFDNPQTPTAFTVEDGQSATRIIGNGVPKGGGYIDDPTPYIVLHPMPDRFIEGNRLQIEITNTITNVTTRIIAICTADIDNYDFVIDTYTGVIYLRPVYGVTPVNINDYFTLDITGDTQMRFTTQISVTVAPDVSVGVRGSIYPRFYRL